MDRKQARFFVFFMMIVMSISFFFYPWITPSWRVFTLPLSGKIVVIDAGHGGIDGGAVGKKGTREKDITLKIAHELRDYLQGAGAYVIMTREGDYDLAPTNMKRVRDRKVYDLKKRTKIINESGADFFISIHLNAISSSKWSGAQTFYHLSHDENEEMAKYIQQEISLTLKNTKRMEKPIHHVYILKKAKIPGVLVEAGFLSNYEEERLLRDEKYQQKMAASIYRGILRYYTTEQKEK
ncbi:N-acetylmuramoyl-L-alanine amidase CwlD [Massilibacterium senegalense]|uniref:N-acetylmuramoyl-L-alanine amidase CwlD n=1 Tax=Massilibacterium senegalense TaxID=1632858 RepID=UPI0009EB3AB7